jgi:hypothetical protein
MATLVTTAVHHISYHGYDVAADQARAAWAAVQATRWAAIAASVLSVAVIFLTVCLPWRQRRSRLRSATMCLGYAMAGATLQRQALAAHPHGTLVVVTEYIDKFQITLDSLDRYFSMSPDDVNLMKFALNMQAAATLLSKWMEYARTRSLQAPAAALLAKFDLAFDGFDDQHAEYERLRKRFRVPDFVASVSQMNKSVPQDRADG